MNFSNNLLESGRTPLGVKSSHGRHLTELDHANGFHSMKAIDMFLLLLL